MVNRKEVAAFCEELLAIDADTKFTPAVAEVPEQGRNDDTSRARKLLVLYGKYSSLVNETFQENLLLQRALTSIFGVIVNSYAGEADRFSTVDQLCSVCDQVLKSYSNGSEIRIRSILDDTVEILGFMFDQDLFADIYRKQ